MKAKEFTGLDGLWVFRKQVFGFDYFIPFPFQEQSHDLDRQWQPCIRPSAADRSGIDLISLDDIRCLHSICVLEIRR
jgi:hypothetical protein